MEIGEEQRELVVEPVRETQAPPEPERERPQRETVPAGPDRELVPA